MLPGFQRKIENYIAKEKIHPKNFPVKKLIILVPSTGYSYPTLKLPHQTDIEPAKRLEDHLENRAGTARRRYRMSTYKLTIRSEQNENIFVLWTLAEGPTPLLTFYEACNGGSAEAAHLQKFKKEVSSNFLRVLERLVQNDPDCRDYVELLYYDDDNGTDVVKVLRDFLIARRGNM